VAAVDCASDFKARGCCPASVFNVSGGCLASDFKASGGCPAGVFKVSGSCCGECFISHHFTELLIIIFFPHPFALHIVLFSSAARKKDLPSHTMHTAGTCLIARRYSLGLPCPALK
jgi:hypothetical protein